MMVVRCTRCKGPTFKGRRYCRPCAVAEAQRYNLDEFLEREPDQEEIDLIAEYERRQRTNTIIGIGVICLVLVLSIWAMTGGL